MQCQHLSIRHVVLILLSFLLNGAHHFQQHDTGMYGNVTTTPASSGLLDCPIDETCANLNYPCIECNLTELEKSCVYGEVYNVTCKSKMQCKGNEVFERLVVCRYCYQTEEWEHTCTKNGTCKSVASPREYYIARCEVNKDVICLGQRRFLKKLYCNWTGGHRWSTALALSITLGGFGADRFYLGHWQEGIGKLFSFGGLGVWTLIDVILISIHYLGPADGSLYL